MRLDLDAIYPVLAVDSLSGRQFLAEFEAPRVEAMWDCIRRRQGDGPLRVLNIGFLNGFVPVALFQLDVEKRLQIASTERRDSPVFSGIPDATKSALFAKPHRIIPLDMDRIAQDGSLEDWDFSDQYDWVILGEVIEHVPSIHFSPMLRFFKRLLAPGGNVLITTPNLHSLRNRIRHLCGVGFVHDATPHAEMGYPHINLYSARALRDAGHAEGYSLSYGAFESFTERARRKARGPATLRRILARRIVDVIYRLMPSTRDDLLVVLRKSETPSSPSAIYGRCDSSFREGVIAARRVFEVDDRS